MTLDDALDGWNEEDNRIYVHAGNCPDLSAVIIYGKQLATTLERQVQICYVLPHDLKEAESRCVINIDKTRAGVWEVVSSLVED